MNHLPASRRLFAPEVIQTSSMDCGPAALKSLLEGHRLRISYSRLRAACQTELDGTSIDTLEEIARQAGLDAEQVMLPADHILMPEAACLPAIAAVRGPSGHAHFVVLWRTHGPLVQVMDPSRGRLWLSREALLSQCVVHTMQVSSAAWLTWARTDDFLAPLDERLRAIGLSHRERRKAIAAAMDASSWRDLALLDATTRMVRALQAAGALARRSGYQNLQGFLELAAKSEPTSVIPEAYWMAKPVDGDDGVLRLRGAVLIRVRGRLSAGDERTPAGDLSTVGETRPPRPLRDLLAITGMTSVIGSALLGTGLLLATLAVVFETVLLRSTVDIGSMLRGPGQAAWAGVALLIFAGAILGLELLLAGTERRLGSSLEGRLRIAFLDKLPRLSGAYFSSRPIADMLERSHALHTVRTLPRLAMRFGRLALEMAITTIALAWINPGATWLALLACGCAALVPLIGHSLVAERDLRARTHAGALSHFHLDALRGRTVIDAHSATPALEREHEFLLSEWAAAALSLQRASIAIEGIQLTLGFALAAWLLLGHLESAGTGAVLLQAYWMLNLSTLGYELALVAREYPAHRSTILRLLEPIDAPQAGTSPAPAITRALTASAALVEFRDVSVRTGGQAVLEDISLRIAAGEHVAIVGPSGAGKSTLLGLLLGWSDPAAGQILVDGSDFTEGLLSTLRLETAWVDSSIQLWNGSLLDNLLYGTNAQPDAVGAVLDAAGLSGVVARLPEGLASSVGEGGARLSAGEAQRVRIGRAFLKHNPRLAILDEPFVGLERDRRRALLTQARQRWANTTLLYVTHDLPETRGFDRVVVIERGRLVEEGAPHQLANTPSSRYRRLLQAHEIAQSRFTTTDWRRLRVEDGRIVAEHARTSEQTA